MVVFVPEARTTDAGIDAAPEGLLVSVTVVPELGAFPVSVTVSVAPVPPLTIVGETLAALIAGADTVRVAVFDTPPAVAVSVTVALMPTGFVVIAAVVVFVPGATVTEAGSVAAFVSLLVSVTVVPVLGAFPVRVTVSVAPVPPVTLVGETLAAFIAGAVTARVAVFVTPLRTALITALALVGWGTVVTVKVFVFAPEATVTDDGTVAAALFPLLRVTTFPPVGAFALSVTVPVDTTPPMTLVGVSATEDRLCAAHGRATRAAAAIRRRRPDVWGGRITT
ncbi:MAG: hypothetical protein U0529_09555 [Thermoanaerobaculia bacterium]